MTIRRSRTRSASYHVKEIVNEVAVDRNILPFIPQLELVGKSSNDKRK